MREYQAFYPFLPAKRLRQRILPFLLQIGKSLCHTFPDPVENRIAQPVGNLLHSRRNLINARSPLHLQDGACYGDKIRRRCHEQHNGRNLYEQRRNHPDERGEKRVEKGNDKCRPDSPKQGKLRAYVSAYIMLIAGVIPPFAPEYLFHESAGKKFHHSRHYRTAQRQENKISFQGSEKKKDQHHTHAVNRAEGAVQKSTVHKFPVLYCSISDFRTPAYK